MCCFRLKKRAHRGGQLAEDDAGFFRDDRSMPPEEVIFGTSSAMRHVHKRLDRVAGTDVPILIRGEIGTGKEILARFIHRRYPGEAAAFCRVKHNDGERLHESAGFPLPGDSPKFDGSHPHPLMGKPVCVGTLYLDDIAEFNAVSQRRLTQLIHDGPSFSVCGEERFHGIFRVICGTQHDISQEMNRGTFREDLFYSINVVSLNLPPLRERREDIPGFVRYFWERYKEEYGSNSFGPSPRLVEAFTKYDWPGNIRELAHVVKSFLFLGSEEKIVNRLNGGRYWLPPPEPLSNTDVSLKSLTRHEVQELERNLILKTLRATRWNRRLAARALNISYRALLYKVKAVGVPHKRIVRDRERES